MPDVSPPRRGNDDEGADYREVRRQIDGSEVRVGIGQYHITAKGGLTIGVLFGFVLLGGLGYLIREQDRMRMELPAGMAEQHRLLGRTLDTTMRLQTCVLALTPDERVSWRSSRWPREWLVAMCPGLLLQAPEPVTP